MKCFTSVITILPQLRLLPPASEVWGKVIFSQVLVCPHGGVSVSYHFLSGCLVPCSFYGGLCPWFHVPFTGGLCQGFSVQGSLSSRVSVWESLSRGVCVGRHPLPRNQKSWWYASYQYAFLLPINSLRRPMSTVWNFGGKIIWTLFQVLNHNLRTLCNKFVQK